MEQSWKTAKAVFATALTLPLFWLVVFFLVPLCIVWGYSFGHNVGLTQISITGTFANYGRAIEPLYLKIFFKSAWFAALTTFLCLVIGFPVALALTFASPKAKAWLLLLIMLPFWTNLLIRTYALIAVLRTEGYINKSLAWLWNLTGGLTSLAGVHLAPFQPLELLHNNFAVVVGLIYVHLPFMVLPLYSALDRLDKSLLEASLDLGAGHLRTIFKVVVPMAMAGIASGILITFIPALGAYLTPDLLGGPDSQMIASVIERQFKRANDWPFGSALSFVLMYLTFIAIAVQAFLSRKKTGGGALMAKPRKDPPGPLDYLRRWQMQAWLVAVGFFLYAPLVALMAFSFNNSRRNIVWVGFTLDYYKKVFNDASLLEAFGNSLTITAVSTVVSLVLGALVALVLWRFRFPGKVVLDGALALPIVVPEICMGVAMLVFFARVMPWPQGLAWPFSLGAIIISHVSFSFPFVAVVVRARMASFNREMEEAARDLGAGEWRTIRDVILPHMGPSLLAGALLAFTLSLDDFVITFFTSGPDTITFPVKVYSMVRFSVTPEVNAASTILIVLTVVLTAVALKLQGAQAATGHGDKP